jgi:hypothetical protein
MSRQTFSPSYVHLPPKQEMKATNLSICATMPVLSTSLYLEDESNFIFNDES